MRWQTLRTRVARVCGQVLPPVIMLALLGVIWEILCSRPGSSLPPPSKVVSDTWELIELALSSRAALAMIPLQDVLGLGSEARMNTPGGTSGNWAWRLEPGQLTDEHAARLRAATARAARAD